MPKNEFNIQALILVPTRELAQQVHQNIVLLTSYCQDLVSATNLAIGDGSNERLVNLVMKLE